MPRSGSINLRLLRDDLGFFPSYQCVWLYRADLKARSPAAFAALTRLEGRITTAEMAAMNARAKLDRVPEERVAADFLADKFGIEAQRHVRDVRRSSSCTGSASTRAGGDLADGGDAWWRFRSASSRPDGPGSAPFILTTAGRDPDDPVAGTPGVHDPLAGDRRQARPGRAFSLQSAADRPQHGHRPARYPEFAPRIGRGPGLAPASEAAPDRTADGLALDPRGNQDGRGHQRRHGHDRRPDRQPAALASRS